MSKHFDLEKRLSNFTNSIIQLSQDCENSLESDIICKQLIEASIAPTWLFVEAHKSEEQIDFIKYLKLALTELRKTQAMVRIIKGSNLNKSPEQSDYCLDEVSQLVAIFTASVKTAKSRL